MIGEMGAQLSSAIGGLVIIFAMFDRYFPLRLRMQIEAYFQKLLGFGYPYIEILFDEFSGERMKPSEAFSAIRNYLSVKSSASAKRLKADVVKDSQSVVLSLGDNEEGTDEFEGVKVWWTATIVVSNRQSYSFPHYSTPREEERRCYKLTFHKRHRELITGSYISHVLKEGKAMGARNRQRKLYTNNPSENWSWYKQKKWNHVAFEHPATFDSLAMETKRKEEIKKDLIRFSNGKEYYAKIGKAWKRGYLLYGPPGTGKSTMIAAMANFLNYDVYDLELTAVKNNTDLRKLLIETSNKSIIVIEDIDCSLDLTGQRKRKGERDEDAEDMEASKEEKKETKVTLSGLLNFIDGIWSACGGERIIVFTTNYVEKLDPALIRRGRMDKHIEMSYCCFEAFKVLAKNYLDVDSHPLFGEIGRLLEEINMAPADVAENLMPKSMDDDKETCLKNLIEALKTAKEEARKREMEEARLKAEKEEKEKKEADLKAEKGKKKKEQSPN